MAHPAGSRDVSRSRNVVGRNLTDELLYTGCLPELAHPLPHRGEHVEIVPVELGLDARQRSPEAVASLG